MKNVMSTVALLSLVIASAAQAAPQMSLFGMLQPHAGKVTQAKNNPEKCADFTGNWKGTCKMTDASGAITSAEQQLNMKQYGCGSLVTDGSNKPMTIGGISSETNPNYASAYSMEWDGESSLSILTTYMAPNANTPNNAAVSKGMLSLKDGKMLLAMNIGTGYKMSCEYSSVKE